MASSKEKMKRNERAKRVPRVVILATGGTIAGTSASAADNVNYSAGQRTIEQLLAAVPALDAASIEAEQLAQLDSKDMAPSLWWRLTQRIHALLEREDVAGVVITHGTDTLEETAYWLARTVHASKPVVLTAAMRPASSLQADGPQNLHDAVSLVCTSGAQGVMLVMGGCVMAGHELRKVHNYQLQAFSAGDAGPVAWIEEGRVRLLRLWPTLRQPAAPLPADEPVWPWVEIVTSHAGAGGRVVDWLASQGVAGLVVAGTGNGTVHKDLLAALLRARGLGVAVLRSTRCVLGHLLDDGGELEAAGHLTPAQARVELTLRLLGRR
jgi:L-asparaginase